MGGKPRTQMRKARLADFNSGLYLIVLEFAQPESVTFGGRQDSAVLGPLAVYIGTAQGKLASRIERHLGLRPKGADKWDIDWVRHGLTATREGIPIPRRDASVECRLAQSVSAISGARAVPGFGNSNGCQGRCTGHLVNLPARQRRELLRIRSEYGRPCAPGQLPSPFDLVATSITRELGSGRPANLVLKAMENGEVAVSGENARKVVAAMGHRIVMKSGAEIWCPTD